MTRRVRRETDGSTGREGVGRVLQKHREMRDPSTQKIYDLHAGFYDQTFGRLVRKRIGVAIADRIELQQGQVALDVGIGTGGSLAYWPRDRGQVVGVDLSPGMLKQAARKLEVEERNNVSLARANALKLPFAEGAFDAVFVSHVISVVSEPTAALRECLRVAMPGSRVVLLNHFRSDNKVVGTIEKLVCPVCTKLGWKSDLALEDLLRGIDNASVESRHKLTKPDLWETVVLRKAA
jgi:phosphatidylethanolamine/phosphatidyl-N-methylethanolamine N-methyltransferase